MKCLFCGKEFTENSGPGRPKKYCSDQCRKSADRENKRIQYVGKRETVCRQCGKELPKNKTRFCSNDCKVTYNHIKAGLIQHDKILQKICPVCGMVFETWKSQKLTCSQKCSRIRKWRIADNQGIIRDYGITLEELAEHYNNICQICGEPVDWNDYTGTRGIDFTAGSNYPSIDHIKPKSKGGIHSWDNVQLTHMKCNIAKGNK